MIDFKSIACDKECRFRTGMSTSTLLGWTPVYDKNGRLVNKNPNTTKTDVMCGTCGKQWLAVTQYGETEFKEVNNA